MLLKKIYLFLIPLLIFNIFSSCDNSANSNDIGTLIIMLTDTPFPIDLIAEANVTINKIEIREDQPELEDNPYLILSEEEYSFNLLDLQNGVTATLLEIEVPEGDYNLLRLYVSESNIKLKDGTIHDLKVPSGAQTGIKIFIKPGIHVEGGLTTELLLDFDVSQSFVVKGNPYTPAGIKGFNFKPVIRAMNVSISGSVSGKVIDNTFAALGDAYIWIEEGEYIYSSFSDENGSYTIMAIPEGTYMVNATKKTTEVEYDTVFIENFKVVAGNVTQLEDIILTLQE